MKFITDAGVRVKRADLFGRFLRLVNDCSFYILFRDFKPPEEQRPEPQPATQ
jgi:hypothetical protein